MFIGIDIKEGLGGEGESQHERKWVGQCAGGEGRERGDRSWCLLV